MECNLGLISHICLFFPFFSESLSMRGMFHSGHSRMALAYSDLHVGHIIILFTPSYASNPLLRGFAKFLWFWISLHLRLSNTL